MRAALLLLLASTLFAQDSKPLRDFSEPEDTPKAAEAAPTHTIPTPASLSSKESEMRAVAERFSPILYQRTAGTAEQSEA